MNNVIQLFIASLIVLANCECVSEEINTTMCQTYSQYHGVYVKSGETIRDIEEMILSKLLVPSICHEELLDFYCSLYLQPCDSSLQPVGICRDVCKETLTCLAVESYDIRRDYGYSRANPINERVCSSDILFKDEITLEDTILCTEVTMSTSFRPLALGYIVFLVYILL